MSNPASHCYQFGPFRLDTTERLLLRDGHPVPLTPKAYEMLLALVQRSGHIVEKDELLKEVWPDSFVEEGNLTQYVFSLRRALGENANERHYIETIPRRGYRFVASVKELAADNVEALGKSHSQNDTFAESEAQGGSISAHHEARQAFAGESWPFINETMAKLGNSIPALMVVGLVLTGLVIASLLLWNWSKKNEAAPNPQVRSIAVMPFKPTTTEAFDQSLGIGMADALITKLVTIKQITVRPTSAIRQYTGSQRDPMKIGHELGVDAVLDGNVQRIGDRIRLTVQLVDARNGSTIWSESFDEQLSDLLAVQDVISERVARALALRLTPAERERLNKRYTQNPDAYQAYLLGRYFFDRSGVAGAVEKSKDYYQQAIKLDPHFAPAYAGLADAYSLDLAYPSSPSSRLEAHDKMQAAALKALELDEALAEAHTALGRIASYDWDWPNAEKEYQRAIELDPNSATARFLYGWYLAATGHLAGGIAELRRALDLDPLSVNINITLGAYLTAEGKYDEAIEQLKKTVALSPTSLWARLRLAQAYEMKGENEQAIAEFQKAIDLQGNAGKREVSSADVRLAQAYAFWGKKAEAEKIIKRWKLGPDSRLSYDVALIYIGLGDKDEAFRLLQKVYEAHDMNLLSIVTDPRLGNFRSDPRYSQLIQRLGLKP
jgi:DNA-binding winged helix-turn-helix (wHTH) protein/TolB-like protein/Tfp pilus assembly protein PilF